MLGRHALVGLSRLAVSRPPHMAAAGFRHFALRPAHSWHAGRRLVSAAAAASVEGWLSESKASADRAVDACRQALATLQGDKPSPVGSAEQYAQLFANSYRQHVGNHKSIPHILNILARAVLISPRLSDHLTLTSLPMDLSNALHNRALPVPVLVAHCNALTAFMEVGQEVHAEWFLGVNGVELAKDIFHRHPDDPTVVAAVFNLLSASMTTLESVESASELMDSVLWHLGNERLYDPKAKPTVEAALAFLRQAVCFEDFARTLGDNVLNTAIRAVRANTADWQIVDHALAFLSDMRDTHKDTGFGVGSIVENDFVLTVIDAMQAHDSDPWIAAAGFKFLLGVNSADVGLLRVGDYHAKVMVNLMKRHANVADVQAYGCLALENIAKANPSPLRKAGATEHCRRIHETFVKDTFVRNCASYLSHSLVKDTRGTPHNFVNLPPEWDYTTGMAGSMLKIEAKGETTYIGGVLDAMTVGEMDARASEAHQRGLYAIEDPNQPFSDEECVKPVLHVDDPSSEEDIPNFELLDDDDPDGRKVWGMVAEELEFLEAKDEFERTGKVEIHDPEGTAARGAAWKDEMYKPTLKSFAERGERKSEGEGEGEEGRVELKEGEEKEVEIDMEALEQCLADFDVQEERGDWFDPKSDAVDQALEDVLLQGIVEPSAEAMAQYKEQLDVLRGYNFENPPPEYESQVLPDAQVDALHAMIKRLPPNVLSDMESVRTMTRVMAVLEKTAKASKLGQPDNAAASNNAAAASAAPSATEGSEQGEQGEGEGEGENAEAEGENVEGEEKAGGEEGKGEEEPK